VSPSQAYFRTLNDRMYSLQEPWVEGGWQIDYDFVCECGDDMCSRPLRMTGVEYGRLRADPLHFAFAPTCAPTALEDVVLRTERWIVVRRPSAAAA
jgi:hypothetical protein